MTATDADSTTTVCPVCGAHVHWLDQRCQSCKAGVRDRVPALDLFGTLYRVLESPPAAFRHIARSEQKNYVYLLFACIGPLLVSAALFLAHAGDSGHPFSSYFLLMFGLGPFVGLTAGVSATLMLRILVPAAARARFGYRQRAALFAYAGTPLLIASVVVLPLQMALFGSGLFCTDPWPFLLYPAPFWILAVLDAACLAVTIFYLLRAYRVHGFAAGRSVAFIIVASAVAALFVLAGARLLPLILPAMA